MDWIERMLGIRPDGGSGAVEVTFFCAIVAVPLLILGRHRPSQRRARPG
jgi:hypothetical protein